LYVSPLLNLLIFIRNRNNVIKQYTKKEQIDFMLDKFLRPCIQKKINLFIPFITKKGVTPCQVSWLSLFLGIASCIFLLVSMPIFSVIFLWLSGLADMLDGSLARFQKKASPLGAVLDITFDRIVEFLIIFTLCLQDPSSRALTSLFMLGSVFICVTTFLIVSLFIPNTGEKSFQYSPGIIERAEAFLFFTLMILLPQYFTALSIIFSLLVFLTAFIRIKEFSKAQKLL
jgi:archaetidylinositol phosphate synthase